MPFCCRFFVSVLSLLCLVSAVTYSACLPLVKRCMFLYASVLPCNALICHFKRFRVLFVLGAVYCLYRGYRAYYSWPSGCFTIPRPQVVYPPADFIRGGVFRAPPLFLRAELSLAVRLGLGRFCWVVSCEGGVGCRSASSPMFCYARL